MFQTLLRNVLKERGVTDIPEVTDIRGKDDLDFLEKSKAHLESLEYIRKNKFKTYQRRKKIAYPTAFILTPITGYIDYWLLMLQRGNDDGGAGLTFLVLGGLYWWMTQPKREYRKAYKEEMLPKIAQLFGNFMYFIDGRISVDKMKPSKILPHHDRYEAEDYFTGQYRGVNIEFSEVDFQQKRRSKNRTYYITVFKGLAVLLDMKSKKFYGHTIIDRNKNKISEWFKEKSSSLKRANLVDPQFEKMFDVYTNDQVEARYLIDPVMMEKLKGLYEEYDGETMMASFYGSKMLILIQSKHNHFEPADLEIPATDPRSILNMKKEIGEILSLIDRLSLYDPMAVQEQNNVVLPKQETEPSTFKDDEDGDSDPQTYNF
ncbi:MAG: DUF3137 domain-containing protein [Alphaproteobacteria bacterium]|nr:DUF3137 domain-containing protein [Alphaproteobacteria bacterium]